MNSTDSWCKLVGKIFLQKLADEGVIKKEDWKIVEEKDELKRTN